MMKSIIKGKGQFTLLWSSPATSLARNDSISFEAKPLLYTLRFRLRSMQNQVCKVMEILQEHQHMLLLTPG